MTNKKNDFLSNNREIVFNLITKNPLKYSRKDILKITDWNLGSLSSFLFQKKLAHLVKASKRVRGKNKYPTDNSVFYRAYDKKKLYEYYKLYNQNQGSLGTNFIKSKYEIESLTQEDMDYLKNQNIKCYTINIPYENRYIFTSYNKLVSYIKNRYKKEDFFKFMKFGEVNHLKKQFHREYITVLDLIKLKAKEFNLNEGE